MYSLHRTICITQLRYSKTFRMNPTLKNEISFLDPVSPNVINFNFGPTYPLSNSRVHRIKDK